MQQHQQQPQQQQQQQGKMVGGFGAAARSAQRVGHLGRRGVRLVRSKLVDPGAALVAAAPLAPSPPLRLLELRPGVHLVPLQPEALVRQGGSPFRRSQERARPRRVQPSTVLKSA